METEKYKITHIQLFDYSYPIETEDGFIYEYSYSANIVINDTFVVQVSGDKNEATFEGVCSSVDCFWNNEENQDNAFENVDNSELEKILEAAGFENNWPWLCDNAEIMNRDENKRANGNY
jgi:hypothetical protein